MNLDSRNSHAQRFSKPLMAGAACVVGVLGAIAATHTGVDLLLVAALCVALFAVERTVGDWLGELIGPSAATATLAACAALAGWYMFNGGGRPTTEVLFATAAEHGYTTIWFEPSSPRTGSGGGVGPSPGVAPAPLPPDTSPIVGVNVATPPPSNKTPVVVDDAPGTAPTRAASSALQAELQGTSCLLTVEPSLASTRETVVIRATVTAKGKPVNAGSVEFVVNGRRVAVMPAGSGGIALTQFSAQVPGAYTINAHYGGAQSLSRSSSQGSLTIVP
jgi:hypothetical protein